ncbi:hypothetical protein [Tenacibaculum sp. UWU-22]|uniref:hypothetical protein n=1 Tax=Tenacibaculum sp. UWU-22 TaxID=3234187 RepID=UPI0034DAE76C
MNIKNTEKDDDNWLLNADVQYKIEEQNSRWIVFLIFIDIKDPNRILVHQINSYRTKKLAEIAALYMQKTAAKNYTGSKRLNTYAYHFNPN